jgi:cytochrome c oxidase subunit 4
MSSQELRELHHDQHAHPDAREYAMIASILTIVTGFEVALFFFTGVGHGTLVGMLMVLMVVKFAMVVGWYMHLKFDERLFTWIFVGGLFIAVMIVLSLFVLFEVFHPAEEVLRQLPSGEEH